MRWDHISAVECDHRHHFSLSRLGLFSSLFQTFRHTHDYFLSVVVRKTLIKNFSEAHLKFEFV